MVWNVIAIVRGFMRDMNQKNISAFAASSAYFLFLSVVPMMIVLCTILPYTSITEEILVNIVTDLTPDYMSAWAKTIIAEVYDQSVGVMSIAVLTTLWTAGKGVMALMRGLNGVNQVEEERNYVMIRAVSALYTLIMLVVIVLSLVFMVFGNNLMDLLLHDFPQLNRIVSFLMSFRFLAVWAVLTLVFSAIYAYLPDKKLSFQSQIPGATFSAVVWSIFSWFFSQYVNRTSTFSIYGSLSIVVIAMFWLYANMYIFFLGALINQYFERDGEEDEAGR